MSAVSIVVVGLNHKTAPIDLLERLTIPEQRLTKALHHLISFDHVLECVILSTCNRIEVYAAVSRFHGGTQDVRNFLSEFCHVAPEDFTDQVYAYHDEGALRHLLRVASSIDSMVVGESEILGQVRRAFAVAKEEETADSVLAAAFKSAFRAGKRARSETRIARNPASISSSAVDLARKFWDGSLEDRSALVVGSGRMARLAGVSLAAAGAHVTVAGRTESRVHALAAELGASALPLSELSAAIARADVLVSATSSMLPVIDRIVVEEARRTAMRARLLIVDIAVPRDVDPEVAELDGVVLRDLDDLRSAVEAGMGGRLAEVSKVEDIIGEELTRFMSWERAGEFAPAAAALVEWADSVRRGELERSGKLSGLDQATRDEIDRVTRKLVAKLLHRPLSKAKANATPQQGRLYLTALRDLFDLKDESRDEPEA